jgi:hypothetical protein
MWGQSVFIILVYTFLAFQVTASIGIKSIQENWGAYRCNPMVLPFAASLSPDGSGAADNFSFCVQEFAMNAAPTLTQPLTYVQNMTLEVLGAMTANQERSMEQSSKFAGGTSSMFSAVYRVLAGVVSEFNVLTVKLMDSQNKVMGTMTAMMYILTTVQYTFKSLWNGVPGQLLRSAENLTKKKL